MVQNLDQTGESRPLRWWIRFTIVPLIPLIAAGLGYGGFRAGQAGKVAAAGKALSYDSEAWGQLYFDDDSLTGLSDWIRTTDVAQGASDEVHFARGRAYHQLGDYAHATVEYEKAQQIPEARLLLAVSLISANNPQRAGAILDEVLAQNRNNIGAMFYRGLCFLQLHQYERARDLFRRVTEQRPELLGARHNLGVCDLHLRDYTSALQDFSVVCDKNPAFARALFDKGVALFNLSRSKEALESLRTAIQLNPSLSRSLDVKEHEAMQTDPVIGSAIRELISRRYRP